MPRSLSGPVVAAARGSAANRGRAARAGPPEFEAWEDWYARQDYRRMPWYSPRPSPWLVRAVRERWIPAKASILDIGCGSGSNSLWLDRQGFRVVGVDISPTAIAAAVARAERAGVSAEFRTANAADLPFRAKAFGAALDNGCFHCLPIRLRQRYAREVARVLRPDSPFLLTWIPREVRTSLGPPHRPALAEIVSVFEPWFLVASVERRGPDVRGGWRVCGTPYARCTALLIRRRSKQPSVW